MFDIGIDMVQNKLSIYYYIFIRRHIIILFRSAYIERYYILYNAYTYIWFDDINNNEKKLQKRTYT